MTDSAGAYESYLSKLHHLKTVLIPQIPPSSDVPLMREYMTRAFNLAECGITSAGGGVLHSIEYDDQQTKNILSMDVAENMQHLPWKKLYGFNLQQVLDLPYDIWLELTDKLTAYVEAGEPTHEELQTRFLRDMVERMDRFLNEVTTMFRSIIPRSKGKENNGLNKRPDPSTAPPDRKSG